MSYSRRRWMQANAGLVEHVHIDLPAPSPAGVARNALAFAAAQRVARAVEGAVGHAVENLAQAVGDFGHEAARTLASLCSLSQAHVLEEDQCIGDGALMSAMLRRRCARDVFAQARCRGSQGRWCGPGSGFAARYWIFLWSARLPLKKYCRRPIKCLLPVQEQALLSTSWNRYGAVVGKSSGSPFSAAGHSPCFSVPRAMAPPSYLIMLLSGVTGLVDAQHQASPRRSGRRRRDVGRKKLTAPQADVVQLKLIGEGATRPRSGARRIAVAFKNAVLPSPRGEQQVFVVRGAARRSPTMMYTSPVTSGCPRPIRSSICDVTPPTTTRL
jgi:hypothetical protein